VIPTESVMAAQDENHRLRTIAELQQKAQSLEAEIAERQRVEERLQAALTAEQSARRESDDALHVRDEFLSIAAHELRNPLASLSLHAQVALRRLSHDTQVDTARTECSLLAISDQATRLSHLLDRLLDVTRLDAGQLTLERQPTDLGLLAERAVASARVKSDQHPITLERRVRLDVDVDPLRLKQVLTNLLDNAIKYSPGGEPIVVTLSRPAPGCAELAVTDRGIGIPVEARARIFERFFQARIDDAAQGLGLGLYVSQQIVELHGGQIRAEFPSHGGTRIVVSLPESVEIPMVLPAIA
ncbi:MAG TPA: HAMP domain-containing sensor histidine kinase, partial [Thermomicrobiales bacterium]|nr:HAMP domain-containing sensor histidine kinase [Thermomicrobiales bacterium]